MASSSSSSSSSSFVGQPQPPHPPPVLTSIRYYEELRRNASWIERPEGSNLDILHFDKDVDTSSSSSSSTSTPDDNNMVAICHISTILDYTSYNATNPQRYEDSLAIALAIHHLNTPHAIPPNILDVPSQNFLQANCHHIKFTIEYTNVGIDTGLGLTTIIDQTSRPITIPSSTSPPRQQKPPRPCAFVGHYRSSMTIPTSMISGLRGYPQISGTSTSPVLDDKRIYPLFARTVGSDKDNAPPALQFFHTVLGVNHLVVLHMNEPYGIAYANGIQEAVKLYYPNVAIATISLPYQDDLLDDAAIKEAIESIKFTRFRYVFALLFDVYDKVMLEAFRQGIAGNPDYVWFFSDSFYPDTIMTRTFPKHSPLYHAYNGIGLLTFAAGIDSLTHNSFAKEMSKLSNNPHDINLIANQTPPNPALSHPNFLKPIQSDNAAFFYDATIALGLSACRATITNTSKKHNLTLAGHDHYNALKNQVFDGVTGNVALNDVGSRSSTYYNVYNFIVDESSQSAFNEEVHFQQIETHRYHNGVWKPAATYANGTSTKFIFSGGGTDIPPDLPPLTINPNYLTLGTRICTYLMLALGASLAIGFAIWTWKHRQSHVVKASQPFFLYVICVGAFILIFSIVPATIDPSSYWLQQEEEDAEGGGATTTSTTSATSSAVIDSCSVACNFIPWLVSLGFSLIFSAFSTKTYRANKILNNPVAFKRITVTVKDVVLPMIGLVSVNVLILSLMTALQPIQWEIQVLSTDYLRGIPSETYGRCNWRDQIPYLASLSTINFGTLCFALLQAYQARHLSTEFAESKYILRALSSTLMITLVCGPVMLLGNENPNSYIFVGCGIVFITSTSTLLWIFLPKIQFQRSPPPVVPRITGLSTRSSTSLQSIQSNYSTTPTTRTTSNNHNVEGERVLSRLSSQQLIFKNNDLKQQVVNMKRDLQRLRLRYSTLPTTSPDDANETTDLEEEEEEEFSDAGSDHDRAGGP